MTILEAPSAGASISTDPDTIAVFMGRAPAGPLHQPILVASLGQFERVFGGHWPGSTLGLTLAQYFQHGGKHAVIVRIANSPSAGTIELATEAAPLTLVARNPGSRERIRASIDYDDLDAESTAFNLTVQRLDYTTGRIADQELFRGLSANREDRHYIGRALEASQLVSLAETLEPIARPRAMASTLTHPAIGYAEMKSFGDDGLALSDYDLIGSDRRKTGLFALDGIDRFDFLYACGDSGLAQSGPAFLLAAERYCVSRNAMLIVDPPADGSSPLERSKDHAARWQLGASVMTYYPALQRREQTADQPLPAAGALAGLLSRQDTRSHVWAPLADDLRQNSAALHRDWVAWAPLEADDALKLLRAGINPLLAGVQNRLLFPGLVTCANASDRDRGALVRQRLRQFILGRIELATRWAAFAPANERTWQQVESQVARFLGALSEQGAFERDAGSPWKVRCDADTNSDQADAGVRMLIGYRARGARQPAMYAIVQRRDGTTACRAAFEYSEP